MRTFKTESVWDAENQEWVEVYFVNGQRKSEEEFHEEMNREVNPEEFEDLEGMEEEFECEDCDGCCDEELSDEEEAEIKLIEEYVNMIDNIECTCGAELRAILYDLFWVGRKIGFNDCRDYIKETLE